MCIYRSTSAIDYSNLWFVRGHTSTARFRFLWSQLFLMRPWALQAPTKRLCSPPQGQGTWSMPTANKIGWARWTSNGSTVESGPGGKIITFAFNNTRFAFTFTEVTKELLPSACVSSICIFPFLPCPGYMLNHKFTQVNYWTQNAMEQNLKLSTSLKRTCPYQLWIPRWGSNHL